MNTKRMMFFVLVSFITMLTACNDNLPAPDNSIETTTHNNPRFNFSVDYPADWSSSVFGTVDYEATSEREALPDAGILIYPVLDDQEQTIQVFGQNGTFSLPNIDSDQVTEFITASGLRGDLVDHSDEGNVQLYLIMDMDQLHEHGYNTRSLVAVVNVKHDTFKENEDTFMDILRSIKVY